MSKPKRYTAAGEGVVRTDPEGDLVLYVEYLRLLIEVDELKAQPDPLTAYLYAAELAKDDIARLKAEVARLQSIHSIDSIGIEQLKAEVERLTADLNKMTKTPEGVDYVEVDVSFWTKSGSRLPSSYSTFWSNDKGVQS